MNKPTIKILSVLLCAALLAGSVGAVSVINRPEEKKTQTSINTVAGTEEKDSLSKDETVYVLAGADGSVDKIIVSDWIKNALGSASISDKSQLTDIENVKGDESYTMNSDGMKVWDARGNDIYYQGNIEKELPVGLRVSYKLDGKAVSAEEIAGKSGKVAIRFEYDNRQFETVEIDGKKEKIYVPFVMLTGVLLDTDTFTNVEVSNGKLMNDGDRIAVMGLAFPGLQENLDIAQDQLEIPSYVEITADVKDFSMGTTITVASNDVFNQIDTEKLNSVDELKNSLGEMTDAMSQLMDGSSQLYDGLSTLLEKSDELVSGIDQLAQGAKDLKDGASQLADGTITLKDGTAQLVDGLQALSDNNAQLNGGAKQVFETLLSTANSQLAASGLTVPKLTIGNYAEVLNQVITSLDKNAVYQQALQTVTQKVEASRPMIIEKVTAAVREQVLQQVTAAVKEQVTEKVTIAVQEQVAEKVIPIATGGKMTKEEYDAAVKAGLIDEKTQAAVEEAINTQMKEEQVQELIASQIQSQMESQEIQATISAKTEEQMDSKAIQSTISQNVESQVQKAISEAMASDEVQQKLQAASEGAKAVIALKSSLDSYNTFYLGLLQYTDGVSTAASGAEKVDQGADSLKDGAAQLKDGTSQLYDGILQLKDGAPALVDGVTQLKDGSMQLSDGLKQFNDEAVQKLADLVNGDLDSIVTRLKATVDVSKNYRNFSGISDEMDGKVTFIYRTEEIES